MIEPAPVSYTAVCERVGSWWEITVPELDEVTQARDLSEVPETVADLVSLITDTDPGKVKVKVKVETKSAPGSGVGMAGIVVVAAAATAAVARAIIRVLGRVPVR